MYKIDLIHF